MLHHQGKKQQCFYKSYRKLGLPAFTDRKAPVQEQKQCPELTDTQKYTIPRSNPYDTVKQADCCAYEPQHLNIVPFRYPGIISA